MSSVAIRAAYVLYDCSSSIASSRVMLIGLLTFSNCSIYLAWVVTHLLLAFVTALKLYFSGSRDTSVYM